MLIGNGQKEAQRRSTSRSGAPYRLFTVLSGIPMDYYVRWRTGRTPFRVHGGVDRTQFVPSSGPGKL
ncbi:hypothetical protein HBB16_10530 [Pseudonocardia sp. MCCB 268]|nr:hypothetical protein [Pseudonocardia cytotoxica]